MSKAEEKERAKQESPELRRFRLGQRVVALVVGLGLTSIAIVKTVLNVLKGDSAKAVASAKEAVTIFVDTVDPDAKSKKKQPEEVSLSRKILSILGGAAKLSLGAASTVLKALKGDITGVAGDLGGIITLASEVSYGIMPFFGSRVKEKPNAPSISDKFIAKATIRINKIIDFVKSTAEKTIQRMEKSRVGSFVLRGGKAIYNIATSKHVKIILQVVTASMALASAITPVGGAIAGLALVAIASSGMKSFLHTRSLRLMNEKKDCLVSVHKERAEQLRLLDQNPTLQEALAKIQAADGQEVLGGKPQRPPINIGREILSAFASSLVGGAAAILQATTADPTAQAATAFVLLGGVAKEARANIKKEISRSDLKVEIWELGGQDKSSSQVQKELLQSKRQTIALTLLAADIEESKSTDNIKARFEQFMHKASEIKKPPSIGQRFKAGLQGFAKDCNKLLFSDIREGWRELMGKNSDHPKPSHSSDSSKPIAKEVSEEKGVSAPTIAPKTEVAQRDARTSSDDVQVLAISAAQEARVHVTDATHAKAPHHNRQSNIEVAK